MALEIKGEELDNLLASGGITVLDFFASWCGPCRVYGPILDEFSSSNPDINVVKLNIETSPDIASKYGIRSIPTTILFKDGQLITKVPGVIQKEKLEEFVGNL